MAGFPVPIGGMPSTGIPYLDRYIQLMWPSTTSKTGPEMVMTPPTFDPTRISRGEWDGPPAGAQRIGNVILPPGQHPPFPVPQPTGPDVNQAPATAGGVEDQPENERRLPGTPQAAGTGVFSKMRRGLQDPRFQAFALNMANRLLQTPGFGETGMQTWGQGLLQGYQGMNMLSVLQQAREQQAREEKRKQEAHQAEVEYKRAQTYKTGEEGKVVSRETKVKEGQLDINREIAEYTKKDLEEKRTLNRDEFNQRKTEYGDKTRQADRQLDIEQGKLDELIRSNADQFKIKTQEAAVATARANAEIVHWYAQAFELRNRYKLTGQANQMDLQRLRTMGQIMSQTIRAAYPTATAQEIEAKVKQYMDAIEKETGISMKSPTGGAPGQTMPQTGSPEPPPGAMLPPPNLSPTARGMQAPPMTPEQAAQYPVENMPMTTSGMPPQLYGGMQLGQDNQWSFPPVAGGVRPGYSEAMPGQGAAPQGAGAQQAQIGAGQPTTQMPAGYGSTAPGMTRQMAAGTKYRLANEPTKFAFEQYPPVRLMKPNGEVGMLRNTPPEKIRELVQKKGYRRIDEVPGLEQPGLPTSLVP